MPRFDVYTIAGRPDPVIDVQADIFKDLNSKVVIPLRALAEVQDEVEPRLAPRLLIQGNTYALATTDIAAVPSNRLQGPIANIEDQRQAIIDAIDFLLQGF